MVYTFNKNQIRTQLMHKTKRDLWLRWVYQLPLLYDPFWPYFPQEPNAQNPPCGSSQVVAIPGYDPNAGSDSVSKSVAVGNAHTREEVIKAPVRESSDLVAVTVSDPILGLVPASDSNTVVKVTEVVVSERSDLVAIPDDPFQNLML